MNKKPFYIFFLTALIVLSIYKIKHHEELRQKMVLANQTRGALRTLMMDFSQARETSLRDVPADGIWHYGIVFDSIQQGKLEYVVDQGRLLRIKRGLSQLIAGHISSLRFRRQMMSPDILEIQVEAKNNISVISNLKVRISH